MFHIITYVYYLYVLFSDLLRSFLFVSLAGDCPAIDFESQLYMESMDILEHHIKPLRSVPGVVLEQAYLNKMADGIKPFNVVATVTGRGTANLPNLIR